MKVDTLFGDIPLCWRVPLPRPIRKAAVYCPVRSTHCNKRRVPVTTAIMAHSAHGVVLLIESGSNGHHSLDGTAATAAQQQQRWAHVIEARVSPCIKPTILG